MNMHAYMYHNINKTTLIFLGTIWLKVLGKPPKMDINKIQKISSFLPVHFSTKVLSHPVSISYRKPQEANQARVDVSVEQEGKTVVVFETWNCLTSVRLGGPPKIDPSKRKDLHSGKLT